MNEQLKQRLDDLLVDRAVGSLDRERAIELEALLEQYPERDDDTMDLAAAAVDLAMLEEVGPMPSELAQKVRAEADLFFETRRNLVRIKPSGSLEKPVRSRRVPVVVWGGWLAAAAMLIIAALGWLPRSETSRSPEEQRRRLLEEAGDVVTMRFQATEDEAASGASGDIIWSAAQQMGFMRIRGLAVNDANRFQYQLWVFDKGRDDRYPIDGGVFDIPVGRDEWIVPIDAKLAIQDPQLYAVTVEKPGGVVVSSRERIALLAKPAG